MHSVLFITLSFRLILYIKYAIISHTFFSTKFHKICFSLFKDNLQFKFDTKYNYDRLEII